MMRLSFSQRQHSVSRRLPARFSLPRWGGTSVYLFLTLSLSLLLFACPDARATPSGSIGVVWYKNDPSLVYSTSGNVGSQAYVHIHFYDTGVMYAPTLKEIRIHEVAGHQQDQVWTNVSFNNGSYPGICPHCGEGSSVHSQFWMTTGFHNGAWVISATVHYLKWGVGNVDWPVPPITVSLQNAIVTPTQPQNPDPILWDPDTMQTVPVSANVDLAYRSSLTAIKLEIFDSSQALVKTVALDRALAPGTNSITYNWDGSQDPPLSGIAPKGIYLFRWTVGHSSGEEDYDCDKSAFMGFGDPPTTLDIKASNTAGQIVTLGRTLVDTFNNPASACKVDVYENWSLNDIVTKPISTALGYATTTFRVPCPSSAAPEDIINGVTHLIYLVSPIDSDSAHDKGHRNRVALQHNQTQVKRTVLTWGGHYAKGDSRWGTTPPASTGFVADAADGLASNLKYHNWKVRGWSNEITPAQLLYKDLPALTQPRPRDDCPNGLLARCIDVAIFCGHGSASPSQGRCFLYGLAQIPNGTDINLYWLATADSAALSYWNDHLTPSPVDEYMWSLDYQPVWTWASLATTGQPVQLIIWNGCYTTSSFDGAGMPQASTNKGARCSVGCQQYWNVYQSERFFKKLATEPMQQLGSKDETVYQAVHHAVVATKKKCPGAGGWQQWIGFAPNHNAAKFGLPR